jgi:hypothetical protein
LKTDELIAFLARGAGPAPRAAVARRLVPTALLGLLVSAGLALAIFGPLRADALPQVALLMKFGYAVALAAAAGWLTARLARPVARLAAPARFAASVLVLMAMLGLVAWLRLPETDRPVALFGSSWLSCPWNVLALSLPGLAAVLWAVQGLAPTRLRAAGFASGVLAGSLGALGYALACPEVSPTFVAIWYTLGILLSGGLGAWLGPRVLRW